MSQTLFIALLVGVVIFVFLYRRKKKVEKTMGEELDALIESDDWQGVCRILRKQLIVWGCVLLKPVTDNTMSVAEEHMGYCEDAVLQGDNLTTLAATIKESTVWTFWWD